MVSSAKTAKKSPVPTKAKVVASPSAKAGKSIKPAVKTRPAAAPATTEPFMRFYHSKELRKRTNAVLDALEATPEHPKHGDAVANLVAELTEAGMDYFYLRALKHAQVGFVTEQSARLGMSGAVMLINSVSRKFIVRMDKNQLLTVARYIRDLG